MIRTILIAVDRSPRAPGVFDAAAELVRSLHAKAFIFEAIVVPQDFPPGAAIASLDALPDFLKKEAHAHLSSLTDRAPDLACEIRVETSTSPWRSIVAMAETIDADLIVVGSHGYHGWDYVVGTNAAQVANRAERSVMVVHDRKDHPKSKITNP